MKLQYPYKYRNTTRKLKFEVEYETVYFTKKVKLI